MRQSTKPSLCYALIQSLLRILLEARVGRWEGAGKMALAHIPSPNPRILSLKGLTWTGVSLGQESLPCSQHHTLGPSENLVPRILVSICLEERGKGEFSEIGPRTSTKRERFCCYWWGSSNTLPLQPQETVAWCPLEAVQREKERVLVHSRDQI